MNPVFVKLKSKEFRKIVSLENEEIYPARQSLFHNAVDYTPEYKLEEDEWMRQKLLEIKRIPVVQIKDVCRIEKGKTPIQKAVPGEYPLVVTTDERKTCNTYQFDCMAVCLSLVSARGHGVAQISRIFYQEGKFALGNILCAIVPNDKNQLSAKFLQHYLFYKKDSLLVPLMKGGANVALHISDLEKVKAVQIFSTPRPQCSINPAR